MPYSSITLFYERIANCNWFIHGSKSRLADKIQDNPIIKTLDYNYINKAQLISKLFMSNRNLDKLNYIG